MEKLGKLVVFGTRLRNATNVGQDIFDAAFDGHEVLGLDESSVSEINQKAMAPEEIRS